MKIELTEAEAEIIVSALNEKAKERISMKTLSSIETIKNKINLKRSQKRKAF